MGINSSTITGDELRTRIDRLGLTINGLQKQMRGERRVSRQTEMLLGYVEKEGRRRPGRAGRGNAVPD